MNDTCICSQYDKDNDGNDDKEEKGLFEEKTVQCLGQSVRGYDSIG